MSKDEKKTAGQLVADIIEKNPEGAITHEEVESRWKDYYEKFLDSVHKGFQIYSGDFYIEVRVKSEVALLNKVIRRRFILRESCPLPEYDQNVYKIDRTKEEANLLWGLPGEEWCRHIMSLGPLVIPPYDMDTKTYQNIRDFADNTLLDLQDKLNGEIKKSTFKGVPSSFAEEDNVIVQEGHVSKVKSNVIVQS